MSRIAESFQRARQQGRTGVVPFVVGGHPTMEATEAVLPALAAAGALAIEVGIPFSDPIADGPVISEAMQAALRAGATPPAILASIRAVRARVNAPIVVMVSISVVQRMGAARFVRACAEAGVDGLIVPDLDSAEAPSLAGECRAAALDFIMLLAATTQPARLRELIGHCGGFAYLLARQGITGESGAVPEVAEHVRRVRLLSTLPIVCGFGIATPAHVAAVTRHADAAVVGSAIVRAMNDAAAKGRDPAAAAAELVKALSSAAALRSPLPGSGTRPR